MTLTPEFDRWQERYATPDFVFGKAPNEFLVRCKDLLPRRGKALAVADGEGRNSVFLARGAGGVEQRETHRISVIPWWVSLALYPPYRSLRMLEQKC